MPYVRSQGLRIHYHVEGDGPPLVCQPGFGDSLESWYELGYVDALKDEYQQLPQNTRRNELPVKLIDGSLVMRHEYVAGAPVELLQIRQTASSADGVLHHPPEPFHGIEVVPTMGR
jgi:hypothetical protein